MKTRQSLDHGTFEAVTSGAVEIIDRAHLEARFTRGDKLRVKLGLDPTRPDLHLGHTVVLRALRRYQQHGHRAVLIIGDWTARIGDPSGQNITRPELTKDQVDAAAQTYLDQVWKILDRANTEVRYQTEWFDPLRLQDVVALLSKYTVARMLAREDFARRVKEGRPVSLHELLYPLLQGYDSVAVKADLELGGTDQTFNLLVGRDLQEAFGQPAQDIQTMPLLEGLDGVQKMSKSLDNYIGIAEDPGQMFWKAMAIPDQLILRYLQLATDATPDELEQESAAFALGENPRDIKKRLARRLVALFHGADAVPAAEAAFGAVVADQIPECSVSPEPRSLAQLFEDVKLVSSKSEARRLTAQKGLTLNNQLVASVDEQVSPQTGWVLGKGKRDFVRLKVG
jgi:tyrosyl-tRNA synthetase